MDAIEPNVTGMLWFALFAGVASLSFYVLTGAFPLESRPDLSSKPWVLALVTIDVLMLLATLACAMAYGFGQLRWTSVVIVSGLAILFAPALFNLWPSRLRDGPAGLGIIGTALGAVLVAFGMSFSIHHI